MIAVRDVQPEWLDTMDPADPAAARSRGDLKRIHGFMRHRVSLPPILKQELARFDDKPLHLVELGAGDGTFLLGIAPALATLYPRLRLTLVDQSVLVRHAASVFEETYGWKTDPATLFQTPPIQKIEIKWRV